jgi:hypothetical protein
MPPDHASAREAWEATQAGEQRFQKARDEFMRAAGERSGRAYRSRQRAVGRRCAREVGVDVALGIGRSTDAPASSISSRRSMARLAGGRHPGGMPDARCPDRRMWSRQERWATAPGEPFSFRIVRPQGGAVADVAEVEYRLGGILPVARTCDRCPAPMPSPEDPVYDDRTLIRGGEGGAVPAARSASRPSAPRRRLSRRQHGASA